MAGACPRVAQGGKRMAFVEDSYRWLQCAPRLCHAHLVDDAPVGRQSKPFAMLGDELVIDRQAQPAVG